MEKYIVIDLETTGNNPAADDKIIDVGIIVIEDHHITEEYSTLLNPNKPIPPFISNLTGIHDKDVKNAPNFSEKAEHIAGMFKDGYLIAHNVPFDLGFLNGELSKHEMEELTNPVIDTVELSRILYPQAPGYQLGQLAEYFNIKHEDPHRALSDAFVTAKLFLILKEKIETLPYETVTRLLHLEKALHSDLYKLLYNRQQKTKFATNERQDLMTYRGIAYRYPEEKDLIREAETLSFGDFLDDIYEENGAMEKYIIPFEKRQGQRDMSEAIFDAFQLQKHALIEAGTGIGKTIAYLLPAVYEAIHLGKRILISTYTTQLQSQILDEEIPLIQKLVKFPFKVALLKGKQHYINIERFERELAVHQESNYDITLTKAMILVWLTETETGDIEEIQLPSSGYFFFRNISAETERFDWFSHSYYHRARAKAQQADLVITNHALLFSDVMSDYQFLPSYRRVIIDEAHHLESVASKRYGLKLDYIQMQHSLNHIGTSFDGNWLTKVLKNTLLNTFPSDTWDQIFSHTKQEIDDFFRVLFKYVLDQKQNKSLSDVGRVQYRFDQQTETSKYWQLVKDMVTRISFNLRDMIHFLSMIEFKGEQDHLKTDQDDLKSNIQTIQLLLDNLENLFLADDPSQVKWIEVDQNGAKNAVYLYSEPMDISELLKRDFFDKKQSVILTSATLTMRNSFIYIQERLGIPDEKLLTMKVESPFNYEDQVRLFIPNDFPDINHSHMDDYIYSTCEAILSLSQVTQGRMLVLFTSYDMLRKAYHLLKETMDLDRYVLIAQGISSGSRTRLKKNFQSFNHSILLGTSSFWEGVDIPGDDLSCIMIVRLPFDPPGHPIYEAKSKSLKINGKNPFMELSLPNAVIRFKQGFGRLIRSTNDRGIVFVCDARIKKARYGKFFTESIPHVPTMYDSTYNLIKKAEEWF